MSASRVAWGMVVTLVNWKRSLLTASFMAAGGCVAFQPPPSARVLPEIRQADPAPPRDNLTNDEPLRRPPTLSLGQGSRIVEPRVAQATGGGFMVNLFDADLAEASRVVLGDLLGVPFTIDPNVQGRITLSGTGTLSRDSVLALFETALRQNGAALVKQGDGYRVATLAEAQGTSRLMGTGEAGFGVTAIPLQFIGAEAARTLLEGTLLRAGAVRSDVSRNLLLVVGTRAERASAAEAIAAFDVNWVAAMSFGIFPLDNSDPQAVIGELETIFQSAQGGGGAGSLRLRPLARLNAILAIGSSPETLKQVGDWVGKLDVQARDTTVLKTYFLDSGKAEETARLLNDLFSGQASRAAPVSAPGDTVTTGSTAPAARPSTSSYAASPPAAGNGPRIIADKLNNALIVLAEPAGQRLVQRALLDIDRQPSQVLVDATIVEVTLSDRLRFGVQWFFETNGIKGLADAGRGGLSSGTTGDANGIFPGFNLIFESADAARLAIDALASITNVTVRSAPSLMVMDNQSAELRVGDRVPVVTRQASNVDSANAPLVNQIEFQDTGVILKVTPRVSSTSVVTLDVNQEVSSVSDTASTGTLTPTISQRKITSTVAVRSGQTLVLGGLIDETRGKSRTGIPFLSEIPLLGDLFSSTDKNARRTELIVFLTPRVLRNDYETNRAALELRDRMDSIGREDKRRNPQAPQSVTVETPPAPLPAAAPPKP